MIDKVDVKKMKVVAKELNSIVQPSIPIDLDADKEVLYYDIKEVCDMLEDGDELTSEAAKTIKEMGFTVPVGVVVQGAAKKNIKKPASEIKMPKPEPKKEKKKAETKSKTKPKKKAEAKPTSKKVTKKPVAKVTEKKVPEKPAKKIETKKEKQKTKIKNNYTRSHAFIDALCSSKKGMLRKEIIEKMQYFYNKKTGNVNSNDKKIADTWFGIIMPALLKIGIVKIDENKKYIYLNEKVIK